MSTRDRVAAVLLVVGVGLVAVGSFRVGVSLGFWTLGASLFLLGLLLGSAR